MYINLDIGYFVYHAKDQFNFRHKVSISRIEPGGGAAAGNMSKAGGGAAAGNMSKAGGAAGNTSTKVLTNASKVVGSGLKGLGNAVGAGLKGLGNLISPGKK